MIDFIVILGPTATGKTNFAVKVANKFNGEIISADSRQVYKGMDIGTGKDLDEYIVNDKKIPYHLIDILDPLTDYSVFQFQRDFLSAFNQIKSKKKIPILCGGTGLYIESILLKYELQNAPGPNQKLRKDLEIKSKEELLEIYKKIDPEGAKNPKKIDTKKRLMRSIEINDIKNLNHENIFSNNEIDNFLVIGLDRDRQSVRDLIKARLIHRIDNGLINEVKCLLDNGVSYERLDYFGLEYKFIGKYLKNELTKNELIDKLHIAICQFAKRQMSWFRRMEKRGIKIHWVSPDRDTEMMDLISNAISN